MPWALNWCPLIIVSVAQHKKKKKKREEQIQLYNNSTFKQETWLNKFKFQIKFGIGVLFGSLIETQYNTFTAANKDKWVNWMVDGG